MPWKALLLAPPPSPPRSRQGAPLRLRLPLSPPLLQGQLQRLQCCQLQEVPCRARERLLLQAPAGQHQAQR